MASEGIASNGRLEFQDVVAVAQQVLGPRVTEAAAAKAFEVLDTKAEGFVPFPELRRALTALDAKLTDREIAELLRDADTDKDGRINYDEFMTVSPRPGKRGRCRCNRGPLLCEQRFPSPHARS